MWTDTLCFLHKGAVVTAYLENFDPDLPSRREAQIQVEKFIRMLKDFNRRFPVEMIETVPAKKLAKMRGQHRHRINQQNKMIDKVIQKLMEEQVVREFKGFHNGEKITPKKVRSLAQKHVEHTNRQIHLHFQRILTEKFLPAATILGKGQLKYLKRKSLP